MKNWKNAEIIEVSISETASGTYHGESEYYHGYDVHGDENCSEGGAAAAAIHFLLTGELCYGVAGNGNGNGNGTGTGTESNS